MKRILPLILCLSMVLSLFVGCAAEDRPYVPKGSALMPEDTDVNTPIAEEKPPQELTLAYYANRAMNPLVANDFTNRMLLSLIYQGLFATSNKFEAVPILCEKFRVSSDYKIYTFYVADATFSDGTPVTIQDVSASFDAAVDSKYYGNRFYQVIKTVINEDNSITFYLRTPMEDFCRDRQISYTWKEATEEEIDRMIADPVKRQHAKLQRAFHCAPSLKNAKEYMKFAFEHEDTLDPIFISSSLIQAGPRTKNYFYPDMTPMEKDFLTRRKLWDFMEDIPMDQDPIAVCKDLVLGMMDKAVEG